MTENDNFWKPIGECPKDVNKSYFIATYGWGGVKVGKWRADIHAWGDRHGRGISKKEPDFYAEIPPLPGKPSHRDTV